MFLGGASVPVMAGCAKWAGRLDDTGARAHAHAMGRNAISMMVCIVVPVWFAWICGTKRTSRRRSRSRAQSKRSFTAFGASSAHSAWCLPGVDGWLAELSDEYS